MRVQLLLRNATYALLIGYSILSVTLSPDRWTTEACGPGRGGSRRLMRRKYPPLVQRQYIPNVSENTLGASGRPEGAIKRWDKRFRELVQNRNPDIEFRDDEGTGADRMMSQRLKEKLSTLAISVMNHWPNVKLRVIEGWDEDNKHSLNSLHYEGRAVDITTNDKDKSKYGMLARLAVEAGFDWVHYESRSHVHCSVKSEKADTIRNNGCFDAASLVETPNGQVQISDLQTNDLVLTMNSLTGQLHYSPFLLWLDRDDAAEELFVELTTKSNRVIRLTSSHLIYLADEPVDLTTSSPPQQQQQQQQATAAAAAEEGGYAGSRNSNYYEYSLLVDGAANESADNNKTTANHSSPTVADGIVDQQQQQQLPKFASSTLPRGQQRPPTIDEITYITYARNSLVGQYLLINDHQPQQQTLQPEDWLQQTSLYDRYRYDEIPTTQGQEDVTSRPASRLDLHYQRNVRRQQYPVPAVKFDQIVSVNFVTRSGRFAPLTREGNIIVNSVVASCYAVISDHDMAHLSFAPVRWLSYLQEWLFGLAPKSATSTRKHQKNISISTIDDTQNESPTPEMFSRQRLEPKSYHRSMSKPTIGVHWYPQLLYRIARYILPTRYLY